MHLAQALLAKDEAVRLATLELQRVLDRNARYYDKVPAWRPDPQRPLVEAIRADDAWYYIPFARQGAGAEPLTVRVNGLTRVAIVDRSV